MKIYDKKTILVSVFIGIPFSLWCLHSFGIEKEFVRLIQGLCILYISAEGIYTSVSKDGYEERKEKERRNRLVRDKLFGKIGLAAYYACLAAIAVSCVMALAAPDEPEIILGILFTALSILAVMEIAFYYCKSKYIPESFYEERCDSDEKLF